MSASVVLDPEVESLLRQAARDERRPFDEIVNQALRKGLTVGRSKTKRPRYRLKPRKLGVPLIDLTKASALSAELEDHELARQMKAGN